MTAYNEYLWGLGSERSAASAFAALTSPDAPVFVFEKFYFNRNHLDRFMRQIDEPVLVAEGTVSEPQVIHLFDSHHSFEEWSRDTRFAAQFEHIADIVARTRSRHDVVLPEEPQNRGLDMLLGNAPIDREWSGIPAAIHNASASIYDEKNFEGRSMATGPCAIDDLTDIEFNQCIASIKVHGVCLLTELKNFGGKRIYLTGDPILEIPNLGEWGFDQKAASAIVVS